MKTTGKKNSGSRSSTAAKPKSTKARSTTISKKKVTAAKKSTIAAKKHTGGTAKKSTTRKPVKKAATAKRVTSKSTVKKSPAKKSPAKKSPAKKKATKTTTAKAKRKPAVKKSTTAKKKAATIAGKTMRKKTAKPAAKKATRKKAAKPAAKKPSARKVGVLKKVAKALRKPSKKKKIVRSSSLHKVLAAHGVEKKAPAVRAPFPAYRGTMPYIFISYSHEDIKEVFRIIKQLNSSRYRIWFDEGIEPGNEWPEVVGRAVLECSQCIVFMSPTAVESRNVRNEINLATSANKNIIVIYLKSTPLSEGLLLQIGTVQYFNKFEMADNEFIDKLKRVLSNDLHN